MAVSYTDRDLDIAARTILGDAGGESPQGQAAVAWVLLNRANDPRWGGSISEVALAPQQFSTWNSGAGGNPQSRDHSTDDPAYQQARRIAEAVFQGEIPDYTQGATHYYSPRGMDALVEEGSQSNRIPRWLQQETERRGGDTVRLGGHIFTGRSAGANPETFGTYMPGGPTDASGYSSSRSSDWEPSPRGGRPRSGDPGLINLDDDYQGGYTPAERAVTQLAPIERSEASSSLPPPVLATGGHNPQAIQRKAPRMAEVTPITSVMSRSSSSEPTVDPAVARNLTSQGWTLHTTGLWVSPRGEVWDPSSGTPAPVGSALQAAPEAQKVMPSREVPPVSQGRAGMPPTGVMPVAEASVSRTPAPNLLQGPGMDLPFKVDTNSRPPAPGLIEQYQQAAQDYRDEPAFDSPLIDTSGINQGQSFPPILGSSGTTTRGEPTPGRERPQGYNDPDQRVGPPQVQSGPGMTTGTPLSANAIRPSALLPPPPDPMTTHGQDTGTPLSTAQGNMPPPGQTTGTPLASTDTGLLPPPALSQNNGEGVAQSTSRPGFWGRVNNFAQDNSDALLAIGAGLLSGDDWASGGAAASQNLLAVNQANLAREDGLSAEERARRDEQARAERDQGFALEQISLRDELDTEAAGSSVYPSPLNLVGRDPETGMEVVRAGFMVGTQYMVEGPDGKLIPASSVMADVRVGGRNETQDVVDGANGIPNATSYSEIGGPTFTFQRESQEKNYGYAIRAISAERDLDAISAAIGPEGVASLGTRIQTWASQNSSSTISGALLNETITTFVNESGLQGEMAASASAWLQAVLRADTGAAYTGAEIADYAATYLPGPGDTPAQVAHKARLRQNELTRFVGTTGAGAPYLAGVLDGTYDLPGQSWAEATGQPAGSTTGGSTSTTGALSQGPGALATAEDDLAALGI